LAELFDSPLERQAERFVSSRPVFCAAPRECNQCSREAFAVVEAGGPVAVGGEYEELLTVKDSVEPELAEPSQFLVGVATSTSGLKVMPSRDRCTTSFLPASGVSSIRMDGFHSLYLGKSIRTSHTASLGASMSTFVSIMMLGIDLPPPMDHAI
jgi:hypothetical protein